MIKTNQKVKVKYVPPEKEWQNGLVKKYVEQPSEGRAIGIFQCKNCKSELTIYEKSGEERECPNCHSTNMKLIDVISAGVVKDIKARAVAYECPVCRKVYKWPVDCCVAKQKLELGEIMEF